MVFKRKLKKNSYSPETFHNDIEYLKENVFDHKLMIAGSSNSITYHENLIGEKGGMAKLELDNDLRGSKESFASKLFSVLKMIL